VVKFRRARFVTDSLGPIVRPIKDPIADAIDTGNRRKNP
jgi:hypothetical protein